MNKKITYLLLVFLSNLSNSFAGEGSITIHNVNKKEGISVHIHSKSMPSLPDICNTTLHYNYIGPNHKVTYNLSDKEKECTYTSASFYKGDNNVDNANIDPALTFNGDLDHYDLWVNGAGNTWNIGISGRSR